MIRILRMIEYVYEDTEAMERSMSMWGMPANGIRRIGINCYIRSAIITDFNWPEPGPIIPLHQNVDLDKDSTHVLPKVEE